MWMLVLLLTIGVQIKISMNMLKYFKEMLRKRGGSVTLKPYFGILSGINKVEFIQMKLYIDNCMVMMKIIDNLLGLFFY